MIDNLCDEIWLAQHLNDDGKLNIPDNIQQIKIDVGLAGEAPNAAIWLEETKDRFVLGIEPLLHHWSMLTDFEASSTTRPYPNFKFVQLGKNIIELNRKELCSIEGRFCGLLAAIDDVDTPCKKIFYEIDHDMGKSGSSSLLEPSAHHKHKLIDTPEVNVVSLEFLLDYVDWERFPFIEHIKTDCEGKDFDVVKSIGKYLDRVVFISSEYTNNGHWWHGSTNQKDFLDFMSENGFKVLNKGGGEINFVNISKEHLIEEFNLNNKTLGL